MFSFLVVSHIITNVFKAEWDTRRVQFLGVYQHVYICCIRVYIHQFLMSCKYSRSQFSIWIFALPEVVYTSLPMPLFTLLSVNMWLSSVSCSWGQGHTAGDEHRKKNCKARQLPVRTLGHWAIYNLSVSPSFAFVFLCSVFIRQSWYQPRSFHAKGNCAVKSELHCLAAPFDFLRCGEAFVKSTMLGHLKKKQNTILRCMNSSVHD